MFSEQSDGTDVKGRFTVLLLFFPNCRVGFPNGRQGYEAISSLRVAFFGKSSQIRGTPIEVLVSFQHNVLLSPGSRNSFWILDIFCLQESFMAAGSLERCSRNDKKPQTSFKTRNQESALLSPLRKK